MKLTDEQKVAKGRFYSEQQLIELAREFKKIPVDGEGLSIPIEYDEHYVRGTVMKLIADVQAWKEEAKTLSDQLNQAMEVLEWIKDAGTDYQSINKAASFLSSLSQETEVNHE